MSVVCFCSAPDAPHMVSVTSLAPRDPQVRKCIEISDLRVFIKEKDVASDTAKGPGKLQSNRIPGKGASDGVHMTNIYNMLLRYLTEMKQIYMRYRKVLKDSTDDPFILTSLQFWCFARDFRLVTPLCSIARLNRWVFSGQRRHSEACPEDQDVFVRALHDLLTEIPEADGSKKKADASKKKGDSPTKKATQAGADAAGAAGAGDAGGSAKSADAAGNAKFCAAAPVASPEYGFYRNVESAAQMLPLHSAKNVLLFRHFMEGLCRVAIARYPQYDNLELQLGKVFKDNVMPMLNAPAASSALFEVFRTAEFKSVFEKHEAVLMNVFMQMAQGDGSFGAGPGQAYSSSAPATSSTDDGRPSTGNRATVATSTSEGNTAVNGAAPSGSPTGAANGNNSSEESAGGAATAGGSGDGSSASATPLYLAFREQRKSRICSRNRRAHVNAHLDVTIRFKDVIQLLWHLGLLNEEITLQTEIKKTVLAEIEESDELMQEMAAKMQGVTRTNMHRGSFMPAMAETRPMASGQTSDSLKFPSGFDALLGGGDSGGDGGGFGGLNLNAAALLDAKKKKTAGGGAMDTVGADGDTPAAGT